MISLHQLDLRHPQAQFLLLAAHNGEALTAYAVYAQQTWLWR